MGGEGCSNMYERYSTTSKVGYGGVTDSSQAKEVDPYV